MRSDRLWAFVGRRLLVAVPLLLLVSVGVFALVDLAPGDPARALVGSRQATPETLAAIRARYHLDDPFVVQYLRWVGRVLRGDLGRSIQGSQLVTTMIRERVGLTAFLGLYGSLVALGLGIPLGVLAAFRRGSELDRAIVALGVFGVSAPAFATGLFLLYVFGVTLDWFPTYGPGEGFLGRAWHLTLPAVALGVSVLGLVVKITRASTIEQLGQDHVAFARARGLPRRRITFAYLLRNALVPVVTAGGLVVVGLVTGAVLVEVTFGLPGLGSLLVSAVQQRDIPVIQGIVLVVAAFVVLAHVAIDVLYTVIDPRIRFGRVEA
ncbi:MAG TPA: ABC transporter permease [Actinomycetota bacterium]|nr:ABC transporter permease [Actinomycetota bacterium]